MKKIYVILLVCASSIHAMDQGTITIGSALQQVCQAKKAQYVDTLKKEFSEILHFPFDNKDKVFTDLQKGDKGILYKLYAKEEYAPLLEILLKDKKLDPNTTWSQKFGAGVRSFERNYRLLTSALLFKAHRNAQVILQYGGDSMMPGFDHFQNDHMYMPLDCAVHNNALPMVECILSHGANPRIHCNNTGMVIDDPLFWAVRNYCRLKSSDDRDAQNARKIISLLLAKGAWPNYRNGYEPFESQIFVKGKQIFEKVHDAIELVVMHNKYTDGSFVELETELRKYVIEK